MASLIHDTEHHAKDKDSLIYTLSLLFASELNPMGWQAKRAGKGNNSWRISLTQDGKPTKIWYFTGYENGSITIRDSYRWRNVTHVFTIKTRTDAIRFVEHVKKS